MVFNQSGLPENYLYADMSLFVHSCGSEILQEYFGNCAYINMSADIKAAEYIFSDALISLEDIENIRNNEVKVIEKNPLTGLPANRKIKEELEKTITEPSSVAVYIDLSDFKPYNEAYGFTAGDNAIVKTAGFLKEACNRFFGASGFLGHIGGDDFLIIVKNNKIKDFLYYLDKEFIKVRDSFYHVSDLSRGAIVGWTRQGERSFFPLTGLCCVAFSPYEQKLKDAEQISRYATCLKEVARSRRERDNVILLPDQIEILPVPLKEFLLEPSVQMYRKRTVVEAMGESGLSQYARILIALLDEPVNVMLKKSIIFALGRLRYAPAEPVIRRFAESDNAHLRTRAVEALGNLGGSGCLKVLGKALYDSSPYVSAAAAKSIGALKHSEGIKLLKEIPENSSKWLKAEAAVSRCELGDFSALSALSELLRESGPEYRKKAAQASVFIPCFKSFKMIYGAFKKEEIKSVKNALIIAAGKIFEKMSENDVKNSRNYYLKIFAETEKNMKVFLITGLGRIDEEGCRKLLKKYAKHGTKWERYWAVTGMKYKGEKNDISILRSRLKDYSPSVRAASADSLGRLSDASGLEYLRKALKDEDTTVRRKASEAVLKIAGKMFEVNDSTKS